MKKYIVGICAFVLMMLGALFSTTNVSAAENNSYALFEYEEIYDGEVRYSDTALWKKENPEYAQVYVGMLEVRITYKLENYQTNFNCYRTNYYYTDDDTLFTSESATEVTKNGYYYISYIIKPNAGTGTRTTLLNALNRLDTELMSSIYAHEQNVNSELFSQAKITSLSTTVTLRTDSPNDYGVGYTSIGMSTNLAKTDNIDLSKWDFNFKFIYNGIDNDTGNYTKDEYLAYGESKYQEGYEEGKGSVDITTDNESIYQNAYDEGFAEGQESVDITVDNEAVYQEGYNVGFSEGKESVDVTIDNEQIYQEGYLAGQESIDITSDNNEVYREAYQKGYATGKEIGIEEGKASIDVNAIRQEAYQNGFNEGVISVDITQDNQAIYEEAYQEGMDDGLIIGFENGKNSIDVSAIEQEAYDRGYQNGYNVGFAEGEYSVDITKDNDTAIHLYITQNKYHTDHEFNLNFDLGYSAGKSDGIEFVYDNIENDEVVTKYVKDYIYINKYYTSTEYIDNYDEGYQSGFQYGYDNGFADGKEVIYKTIESDPIIKEYYKEKLINGTKITFVQEGDEVVRVVKNYDINETDTGDFRIIIHNGQDTYTVETIENVIPGESDATEIVKESDNSDLIDFFSKFGIILLAFIGTIGVIWLFKAVTNITFKGRGNNREKSFAV